MQNISNKLLAKLADKSQKAGLPVRSDLFVSDMHAIDSIKCRILLGFAQELGVPDMRNIEEFIGYTFNGKVHAQTASARIHKAESAVSFIGTLNTATRPLTDSAGMRRIAGGTFSDDNTGNIWHIVDDGEQKYLMRQTTENIADIVAARKQHQGRKDASFATIKTGAPVPVVGDSVKFMSPDNVLLLGDVVKLSDTFAVIKANNIDIKVDRQAIIQIVERAKNEMSDRESMLTDYFTKAYGDPEFARALTDKQSGEKGLGKTVPSKGDLEQK